MEDEIKSYIEENKNVSYSDLQRKFNLTPDYTQKIMKEQIKNFDATGLYMTIKEDTDTFLMQFSCSSVACDDTIISINLKSDKATVDYVPIVFNILNSCDSEPPIKSREATVLKPKNPLPTIEGESKTEKKAEVFKSEPKAKTAASLFFSSKKNDSTKKAKCSINAENASGLPKSNKPDRKTAAFKFFSTDSTTNEDTVPVKLAKSITMPLETKSEDETETGDDVRVRIKAEPEKCTSTAKKVTSRIMQSKDDAKPKRRKVKETEETGDDVRVRIKAEPEKCMSTAKKVSSRIMQSKDDAKTKKTKVTEIEESDDEDFVKIKKTSKLKNKTAKLFENLDDDEPKLRVSHKRNIRMIESDEEDEKPPKKEVLVNDSFSEEPPCKKTKTVDNNNTCQKGKVMKKVDKTYMDDDGFLVTERVMEYVSDTEQDSVVKTEDMIKPKENIIPTTKSHKKSGAAKALPINPKKTKQPTLMSFFQKKT